MLHSTAQISAQYLTQWQGKPNVVERDETARGGSQEGKAGTATAGRTVGKAVTQWAG